MDQTSPLMQLSHVYLKVGQQCLLENISFVIQPSQIITLLGPNGAGKSSLARLLVGLAQPTSGVITRKPALKIGFVPQQMTPNKNLPITVARFLSSGRSQSSVDHDIALKLAQASHLKKKCLHVLSGGERQRVLLARALLGSPDLLVLDEPMQGIDLQGQEELYGLLYSIQNNQKMSIFLISHDLHIVMSESNYIMCLNKHLCCSGASQEIQQDPAFLKMFGLESTEHLALYQHRHDHRHGFH